MRKPVNWTISVTTRFGYTQLIDFTRMRATDVTLPAGSHGSSDPGLAVNEFLHEEPYTSEDIENITEEKLYLIFANSPFFLDVLKMSKHLMLIQRTSHVYSEVKCVHDFKEAVSSKLNEEDMPL